MILPSQKVNVNLVLQFRLFTSVFKHTGTYCWCITSLKIRGLIQVQCGYTCKGQCLACFEINTQFCRSKFSSSCTWRILVLNIIEKLCNKKFLITSFMMIQYYMLIQSHAHIAHTLRLQKHKMLSHKNHPTTLSNVWYFHLITLHKARYASLALWIQFSAIICLLQATHLDIKICADLFLLTIFNLSYNHLRVVGDMIVWCRPKNAKNRWLSYSTWPCLSNMTILQNKQPGWSVQTAMLLQGTQTMSQMAAVGKCYFA